MGFFKEGKSMKYKNKDGIELDFTGNDGLTLLVKEVVSEAVKILGVYDSSSKMSMNMAIVTELIQELKLRGLTIGPN